MAVRRIHRDRNVNPDDQRLLHQENMARYEAENRSLGSLVSELATEVSTLFRKEVELVKLEASQKASSARNGAISLAVGGMLAFAGFIVLLMAAAYGLGTLMHMGWAALIVGAVALVLGGIVAMIGASKLKPQNLAPARSSESLREDMEFAKEKARGTR